MMSAPVDDRYVFQLTDDTGMFQHAVYGVPDPSEGYTTDDNARALMMAVLLYEHSPEARYENLLYRYLSFLFYAQKGGWFRNFMDYDRRFKEKRGSEDCFGRCIYALGFTASQSILPYSIREASRKLLQKTFQSCNSLTCLKSKAYALTGLTLWSEKNALKYAGMLSESILDTYAQCRREDWRWFEDKITYGSATLPSAIFGAYEFLGEKHLLGVGLESLDFLLKITMKSGVFKPVGCKGWFERGKEPAEFDEQPVEACSTMLACLKAYRLTGEQKYRESAQKCCEWYRGGNSRRMSLIDPETGGCRDGITKNGINENEGAESIVCCLIASLEAEKEGLELLP